jgi:hypothetical protein
MIDQIKLVGITNSSGAVTVTGGPVSGRLIAVEWIDGDLADGVDAVLSVIGTSSGVDYTLLTLTNADNDAWYYPRRLVHDEAGVALTGTSGGDRAMAVILGTLKLVISSGGDSKTGGCVVYYER